MTNNYKGKLSAKLLDMPFLARFMRKPLSNYGGGQQPPDTAMTAVDKETTDDR